MSTWLFLRCDAHDPPLLSRAEVGQHLYDLPRVRAWLADPGSLRDPDQIEGEHWAGWPSCEPFWEMVTARFLASHPHCPISIQDEHGETHSPKEAP